MANLLVTGAWRDRGRIVKRNRKRTVARLPLDGTGSLTGLYVKHDHPRSWRDRIKSLWRCKAEQEFLAGQALAAAGVTCVPMLAWGRQGTASWLVTGELPGCRDFLSVWKEGCAAAAPEPLERFLRGVAVFQARLAQAGVDHPDLHAGNVLIREVEAGCELVLVDVYGVRLSRRHAVAATEPAPELFFWIAGILQELPPARVRRFWLECGGRPERFLAFWAELWDGFRRYEARHWLGRRERLTQESSLVQRVATERGSWHLFRPFPLGTAERVVAGHDRRLTENCDVLKRDAKRCLTRVTIGDTAYVVKEYRHPGPWGWWSADARAWLNSQRLSARGRRLAAAGCRAWLRAHDGRGFLVFDDAGPRTLATVLRGQAGVAPVGVCRWLEVAGRLVARLHRAGIFHADLKPTNFMAPAAEDAAPWLGLVDLDDVRFGRVLPEERRRRNLAQLLDGVGRVFSGVVPVRARLHLLAAYRRETLMPRPQFRRLVAGLDRPG